MKGAADGSWQKVIADEWVKRRAADPDDGKLFPLAMNPFGEEEIIAMTEVLLSGKLTLGANVEKAERMLAEKIGSPYAVMVNSGSSANLLAVSAIVNKFRPVHCEVGDEVLVPAVSWSTSVFPLIQCGLKPRFVDADPKTFNMSLETLEKAMRPTVKAVMAVHVLGNSICMRDLQSFVKKYNLMLVEDTCESLGSYFKDEHGNQKMLGTLGDFGCYSFYFSHHITSGEGGAIACRTEEDYNFLRCLRAHGWTRHQTNREKIEAQYPHVDPRFLFINLGYNLRPMEVQGAMLIVQLAKLDEYNSIRRQNLTRIKAALEADARFGNSMRLMDASDDVDPAWFGIAVLLHEGYAHQHEEYLAYLTKHGIENRPIISGNFIRQPSIAKYCEGEKPEDYPGSETIHRRGFFIGVHQVHIDDEKVKKLVALMLEFEFSDERASKKARLEADDVSHVHEVKTSEDFWRVQIEAVYRRRNPAKLCNVGALLEKHKGKEAVLYAKVCKTYDLDPKLLYADEKSWEAYEKDVIEDAEVEAPVQGTGAIIQNMFGAQTLFSAPATSLSGGPLFPVSSAKPADDSKPPEEPKAGECKQQ